MRKTISFLGIEKKYTVQLPVKEGEIIKDKLNYYQRIAFSICRN